MSGEPNVKTIHLRCFTSVTIILPTLFVLFYSPRLCRSIAYAKNIIQNCSVFHTFFQEFYNISYPPRTDCHSSPSSLHAWWFILNVVTSSSQYASTRTFYKSKQYFVFNADNSSMIQLFSKFFFFLLFINEVWWIVLKYRRQYTEIWKIYILTNKICDVRTVL